MRGYFVAYCVETGCRCLDRQGIIVEFPEVAPPGYAVEWVCEEEEEVWEIIPPKREQPDSQN